MRVFAAFAIVLAGCGRAEPAPERPAPTRISGLGIGRPHGVVHDRISDVYVIAGERGAVHVDPKTHETEPATQSHDVAALAVDGPKCVLPDGRVLVVDRALGLVAAIGPAAGERTSFASHRDYATVTAIAAAPTGDPFAVTDDGRFLFVSEGDRTPVAAGITDVPLNGICRTAGGRWFVTSETSLYEVSPGGSARRVDAELDGIVGLAHDEIRDRLLLLREDSIDLLPVPR